MAGSASALGSGFLERAELLRVTGLGYVWDLRLGDYDPSPGPELAIVGGDGLLLVNAGKIVSKLSFEGVRWPGGSRSIRIVDVNADGNAEYLRLNSQRTNWSAQPIALFDHQGKVLWTFEPNSASLEWVEGLGPWVSTGSGEVGDLDGDGSLDLVISGEGTIGLQRVDVGGERVWWQRTRKAGQLEVDDLDSNGRDEIVYIGKNSVVEILDADGELVSQSGLPERSVYVDLIHVSGQEDGVLLAAADWQSDSVFLVNLKGEVALTLQLPELDEDDRLSVSTLRLDASEGHLLAVQRRGNNSCSIYLWDSGGKSIFKDQFDELCTAMTNIPAGPGGVERLLVGGEDVVWHYRPVR